MPVSKIATCGGSVFDATLAGELYGARRENLTTPRRRDRAAPLEHEAPHRRIQSRCGAHVLEGVATVLGDGAQVVSESARCAVRVKGLQWLGPRSHSGIGRCPRSPTAFRVELVDGFSGDGESAVFAGVSDAFEVAPAEPSQDGSAGDTEDLGSLAGGEPLGHGASCLRKWAPRGPHHPTRIA